MEQNKDNIEDKKPDYCKQILSNVLRDKQCVYCKRIFCRMDWASYSYKIHCKEGSKYFCSWSCMSKYRNEHKEEKLMPVATEKELKVRKKYRDKVRKRYE